MNFLQHRQRDDEWMDAPGVDPKLLADSLAFIRRINRLLRYTQATLTHLQSLLSDWPAGKAVTLLDVATGSADIPRAMLAWAKQRGIDLRVIAVDLHPLTAQLASQGGHDDRLQILRADAARLPFADSSIDIVHTAMFLHHLDETAVVTVLSEMHRVANHGLIIADLLRTRRAYAWITLFTLMSNPMVKHDARVSVAQAFDRREITDLATQAGAGYAIFHRHFGHRFVLSGRKGHVGI